MAMDQGRGPDDSLLQISANGSTDLTTIRNVPSTPVSRTKVIKFSNVSKRFTLHHERARSFQDLVVSLFGLRTLSKRGVPMPRPSREAFWALQDVSFGVYAG